MATTASGGSYPAALVAEVAVTRSGGLGVRMSISKRESSGESANRAGRTRDVRPSKLRRVKRHRRSTELYTRIWRRRQLIGTLPSHVNPRPSPARELTRTVRPLMSIWSPDRHSAPRSLDVSIGVAKLERG